MPELRMLRGVRCLLAVFVAVPARGIVAQDTTTIVAPPQLPKPAVDSVRCGFCPRPSVPLAIANGILTNVIVNRFNAWVIHDSTSYITLRSWGDNFRYGWEWDTDDFVVNMLAHPYAGATYFRGARSNGLSFWAGIPITAFHSVTWEYLGETTRPSVNDLVNTTLGGIALGEMFYRVAATIRNNELTGGERVLHELGALPFDPAGSITRLFRGEWSRQAPNPSEHNPVGTVLRAGAGIGLVREPGTSSITLKDAAVSSVLFADLKYGDSYLDSMRKPFDAFSMRILVAPGHGGLTQLVGVGHITGKDIGSEAQPRKIEVNQRFEYVNNGAMQFGAQTIQLGLSARSHIIERFWVRALVAADGLVLAGINAPGAGVGARKYDFGPGVGGTFTASIERQNVPYLTVRFQPAYTHTLSGADADHYTTFGAVDADIPVLRNLQVVIQGSYYSRVSRYADGLRNSFAFPELRIFAAYKTSH